jgi:hypothetical protein
MSTLEISQLLGNYGEFVGAIAIVATLVYLALQVRHSREALNANTSELEQSRRLQMAEAYQARASCMMSHYMDIVQSDLPEIRQKGSEQDEASLTFADRFRNHHELMAKYTHLDNVHFQHQKGFIDDEYYDSFFRAGVGLILPSLIYSAPGLVGAWRKSFRKDVLETLEAFQEDMTQQGSDAESQISNAIEVLKKT